MKFHEFADIFPMLPERELAELAADIKVNGLRDWITTFDGKILDGRNRFLACQRAGVEPVTVPFHGTREEALRLVVSLNIRRRHLDESQRAMVAARIATLGVGRPSERAPIGAITQKAAATLLSVGEGSVDRAKSVLRSGAPEVVRAVERGEMAVSTAAVLSTAPPARQREIAAMDEKEILRAAKEIKRERAVVREATLFEREAA